MRFLSASGVGWVSPLNPRDRRMAHPTAQPTIRPSPVARGAVCFVTTRWCRLFLDGPRTEFREITEEAGFPAWIWRGEQREQVAMQQAPRAVFAVSDRAFVLLKPLSIAAVARNGMCFLGAVHSIGHVASPPITLTAACSTFACAHSSQRAQSHPRSCLSVSALRFSPSQTHGPPASSIA